MAETITVQNKFKKNKLNHCTCRNSSSLV